MSSGRRSGSGNEGNRSLAGAHITLKEAQHRRARCKVGKDFVDRTSLVSGPRCLALCFRATDTAQDCRFDAGLLTSSRLDAEGAVTSAATTAMHERNLHCEQLIKGEAAECRIAKVKLLWPVQRLNRLGERHETVARLHRLWQRINKIGAELVEKRPHRTP
jgi:hypothetical protein